MIKKYKIAFYGFQHAHINALYKKVIERNDFVITHLVEPTTHLKEVTEANLGVKLANLTLEELLSYDFDILAVGTAYGQRADVIIKALSAGKHVIADKPICTNREELKKIKALTEEKGLVLACMLDLRVMDCFLSVNRYRILVVAVKVSTRNVKVFVSENKAVGAVFGSKNLFNTRTEGSGENAHKMLRIEVKSAVNTV